MVGACGSSEPEKGVDPDRSVESAGDHSVATTRFTLVDTTRKRELRVQAWMPTDAQASEVAISTLEPEPDRTTYDELLAEAPACPTRTLPVAVDAPAASGRFPVVVFSHCHGCTRLSNATSAVRLASHGFVVLAVDHATNTLWDNLAGTGISLDPAFLPVRVGDLSFVLDQLEAGETPVSDVADLSRVGVLGHSFGAVTAGALAQDDPRIAAAAALAAPVDNPLIAGATLAEISVPLLFVVATEDNSITEIGNDFIRRNFAEAAVPAWKLELPDAGHWSVSDLVGLVDDFAPGCGDGVRQTDDQPFTYLDPATGRAVTAAAVTAFFRATLNDDAGARAYLEQTSMAGVDVLADHHD
jgi:predicted dienelactone hydrolase